MRPEAYNVPNGHDETKFDPKTDPFLKLIGDDKNVPWYSNDLETIQDQARELLEKYSKIPADKVNSHILEVVGPTTRNVS